MAIRSNAAVENIVATLNGVTDTRGLVPSTLSWTSANGYTFLQVTSNMAGNTFYYVSSLNVGVSLWIVVQGPTDVVVPVPSSADVGVDVSVPFGARIIWSLQGQGTTSYARLSESDGSVVPFDSLLYTLAYGQNYDLLFSNVQTPLQYRHTFFATPPHVAQGVFYYKDMFRAQSGYTFRALVASPSGEVPTTPPNDPVPEFRDYFATSKQGIKCDCTFGGGAQPACVAAV